MNQGRIWCVVSPNVGLPLLLGSVAVTSLIVHACVLTHTTWMPNYWQGAKPRTSEVNTPPSVASVTPNPASGFTFSVSPVAATPGKAETSFVITVSPNTVAGTTTASAESVPAQASPVNVASAKLE